jgi:hypothetical protein
LDGGVSPLGKAVFSDVINDQCANGNEKVDCIFDPFERRRSTVILGSSIPIVITGFCRCWRLPPEDVNSSRRRVTMAACA